MSELVVREPFEVEPFEMVAIEMEVIDADEQGDTLPVRRRSERGMVSAEWAVGLIAAIAIAGVLLGVVTTGTVKAGILAFIIKVIGAFANHIGQA